MAQEWTGLSSNRTIADITKREGDKSVAIEKNRPTDKQIRYYKSLLEKCIKYGIQPPRPKDIYESKWITWRVAYHEAIEETIKLLNDAGHWDGYVKERKYYSHESGVQKHIERSKRAFAHVPKY